MNPTEKQLYKCFCIMQSLSNILCNVEVFRYDNKYRKVYILAVTSLGQEIQIEINSDGEINYL